MINRNLATVNGCGDNGESNRLRQSGFSLIEVLVAIIILSLGMFGAVGMQTAALQSNKEAQNQAAATTFARDLAERMRGNNSVAIKAASAPGGNPYMFDVTLLGPSNVSTPTRNCFRDANGCPIKEEAASWDVSDWQSRVEKELPSARVKVCFDSDPFDSAGKSRWACTDTGDVAVLKISWNRNNTAGKLVFTSEAESVPALVVPLTAGN